MKMYHLCAVGETSDEVQEEKKVTKTIFWGFLVH